MQSAIKLGKFLLAKSNAIIGIMGQIFDGIELQEWGQRCIVTILTSPDWVHSYFIGLFIGLSIAVICLIAHESKIKHSPHSDVNHYY